MNSLVTRLILYYGNKKCCVHLPVGGEEEERKDALIRIRMMWRSSRQPFHHFINRFDWFALDDVMTFRCIV